MGCIEAASCQHITFAVAAEYALYSSPLLCHDMVTRKTRGTGAVRRALSPMSSPRNLLKLLDAVPGSSLTIFSGPAVAVWHLTLRVEVALEAAQAWAL